MTDQAKVDHDAMRALCREAEELRGGGKLDQAAFDSLSARADALDPDGMFTEWLTLYEPVPAAAG